MPSGTTGVESATGTPQSYGRAVSSGHRRDGAVLAGAWVLLAAARAIGPHLAADVRPELAAPWSPARLVLSAACAALLALAASRMRAPAALLAVVASGTALGAVGWADHSRADRGAWRGTAVVVGDVEWRSGTARGVLSLDGRRHWVLAGGTAGRALARAQPGERLRAGGVRLPLTGDGLVRGASRHVVGRFEPVEIAAMGAQPPALHRSATRARDLLARGASHLPPREAALFLGLAIGDDAGQPPEMVSAFRAAGLSHLTAVSGQNVAYVLALAAPLLSRRAPAVRTALSLALLAWFVVVTRAEPSVVRAATMAAITAVALALGHRPSALRVLALCVAGVVLADPMLVHSVGFALSVAATAGLSVLAAPIARRLPGPRWLASLAAASIAAQVGVAPVQLAIFGPPPCTALAANVLAVPVASLVMLVGLPVTLVLGLVAPLVASVAPLAGDLALFPLRIGVRWIWWVAEIGAAVSARAC